MEPIRISGRDRRGSEELELNCTRGSRGPLKLG